MEIITQKHLLKKTFNNKAQGIIEVVTKPETKDIILYTWIKGDYDTLSNITDDKIKNAMEALFDEERVLYVKQ